MTFKEQLQAFSDFTHPNVYELKKYLIKDGKTHPFALVIPGGGYGMVCSFVEGRPFAEELNKKGYHVFVLYYHVRGFAKYPRPLDDVRRAMNHIINHQDKYNVTLDDYIVIGSSAGGHLTGMYLRSDIGYLKYNLPRPKAGILVYPVVSLNEPTHQGTKNNILGKKYTQEEVDYLSLDKNITKDFVPTYFWCGDSDIVVDPIHTKKLDVIMTDLNVNHKFHLYPGVGHGVGLAKGTNAEGWFDEAMEFIERL